MRKSIKRIITLCLAVMMLASVMSISSFAATKTYGVYTSLGDSIPAGYGLPTYNYANPPTNDEELKNYDFSVHDTCTRVDKAYPALVSDGMSINKTNYYAKCGYRSVELRALLDPTYQRTDLDQYMLYTLTGNVTSDQSEAATEALSKGQISTYLADFNADFNAQSDAYKKAIAEADLITLNFGSNDTMTYGMYNIKTADGWATEMAAGMQEGYERFKENFTWICKYIYSVNPDVKIAVVGMYNPFRGATLTEDTLLPLGNMADTFVGLVNTFLSTTCPYASKYTYVDVTNTTSWGFDTVSDVLAFTGENSWEFTVKVHPDVKGHEYMANQIINTLNSSLDSVKDKINSTNDKITNDTNSALDKIHQANQSVLDRIKNAISSSSSSGSNATPAGDDVTALEDVSFNTTDHNAYVKGYADGSFGPEKSITRAETAQMLYNLLSAETVEKYGSNNAAAKFSDVNASAWYNVAVSTLVSTGAINGYSDNTFKPDKQITRAEFVKMVMSIAGISSSATPSFSDTATNAWYSPAVGTAQKAGFIEGSGGAFRPNANMTRAEAVTFMNRVLGRTADTTYIGNHLNTVKTFTDVSVNAWYYKAVMEAANGHTYSIANNTETWTAVK